MELWLWIHPLPGGEPDEKKYNFVYNPSLSGCMQYAQKDEVIK